MSYWSELATNVTLSNYALHLRGVTIMEQICRKYPLTLRIGVVAALVLVGMYTRLPGEGKDQVHAQSPQTITWSPPQMMSAAEELSWFPDLAVDSLGRLHLVWETIMPEEGQGVSSVNQVTYKLMHDVWDGQEWSGANDIFARRGSGGGVMRETITADSIGNVYATHALGWQVAFMKAPAADSLSATAWSEPRWMSGEMAYMSDVAVDEQGTIHLIYDQWVPVEASSDEGTSGKQLSDLFYRRSEDGGLTWSVPANLSNSPVGVTREQIKIDSSGTIYITWDEGWDRLSLDGEPRAGVLIFSTDGGQSWSAPTIFAYPENKNSQLAAASDGHGYVLAVWQAWSQQAIYYTWSTDGGYSWAPPQRIPGFITTGLSLFDAYDMAVDSAGNFHLVAVGYEGPESDRLGVYHLMWNRTSWSEPTQIYKAPLGSTYAESHYPKIAIGRGNRLYATWWVGDFSADAARFRQIWFSKAQVDAPEVPLPPTPTPTPLPTPTDTLIPAFVSTSVPVSASLSVSDVPGNFNPNVIYTENDDVLLLFASLVPPIVIVLGVVMVRRGRRPR